MTIRLAVVTILLMSVLAAAGCRKAAIAPATSAMTKADSAAPAAPAASRVIVLGKPADSPLDLVMKERLQQPITLGPSTLTEVLTALREQAKIDVVVNWAALEASNVKQEVKIDRDFKAAAARHVLRETLRAAGRESLEPIGWAVRHGVVHLSTARDLHRDTHTRMYLLPAAALHPRWREPREDPFLEDIDLPDDQMSYDETMEQITTLIQDTVGVQSQWSAYGGEVSSLHDMHGMLVIRTTPDNHADIELLLNMFFAPGPWGQRELALDEAGLLVSRADALRMKQRYAEALRCIDDALAVAPDHARARAMKRVLEGAIKR